MTNQEAIHIIENVNANTNCDNCFYKYDATCKDCRVETALKMGIEALENQKTGHWINKPNIYGVVYCSECDYELHTNNTNYCPHCGSKMKGE